MPDNEQNFFENFCKPEFCELKENVNKVLHILQGNGSVGLCEQVRNQGARINTLESDKQEGVKTKRRIRDRAIDYFVPISCGIVIVLIVDHWDKIKGLFGL